MTYILITHIKRKYKNIYAISDSNDTISFPTILNQLENIIVVSYEQLNKQNHKITELSNILSVLLEDRLLCDSKTCCKLFYEYMSQVTDHIHEIDSNLYLDLLKHPSQDINNIANNFMSGSQEIKRIMNRYERRWCNKKKQTLTIGAKHERFLGETNEMFDMILNRVQNEMEHLYPTVRQIQGDA